MLAIMIMRILIYIKKMADVINVYILYIIIISLPIEYKCEFFFNIFLNMTD